jgi:1-acyl-sn-glycerol-3-phosphate acyltransferase
MAIPHDLRLLERLLPDEDRRRLAVLGHLVEKGRSFDRFGLSPAVLRRAFPVLWVLYRMYFRVRSRGHRHIPADGAAILVANRGGLLPMDHAMGVMDTLLHTDPPRLARTLVGRRAGTLPFASVLLARTGQVFGARENLAKLLGAGQLVLVFPEKGNAARKPVAQRYRLRTFSSVFVEEALRSRTPVVPVAFIGTEEQTPLLYDLEPLARRLGLPFLPVTPTFPWLGPLGLLPYPVRFRIVYGEPLRFHDRFGPEAAEDEELVVRLADEARRAVQRLVDRNR